MNDFANSVDSEGNTRGKIVNGKVYLSIGQLVEYIDKKYLTERKQEDKNEK